MLISVLRMPYDMAMLNDFSKFQYHSRGKEAADLLESLWDEVEKLREELKSATFAERERCAKLCENTNEYDDYSPGDFFANLIRSTQENYSKTLDKR